MAKKEINNEKNLEGELKYLKNQVVGLKGRNTALTATHKRDLEEIKALHEQIKGAENRIGELVGELENVRAAFQKASDEHLACLSLNGAFKDELKAANEELESLRSRVSQYNSMPWIQRIFKEV